MEDRTVAMLTAVGKVTVASIDWEFTLIFGYIVVLDEGGYELL